MPTETFEIGGEVCCGTDVCGHLTVVTVDRATETLTHLIVQPDDAKQPRLVPAGLAHATPDGIRLDCTAREFEALGPAFAIHLPPAGPGAGSDDRRLRHHDEISSFPAFGLGPIAPNPGLAAPVPFPVPEPRFEIEDLVPATEARVHGDVRVRASDGTIGHVAGVAVDAADLRVTHVLLDEGHLWGHKRVAIPMRLVLDIAEEGIAVRLSKRQVKDLPAESDRT